MSQLIFQMWNEGDRSDDNVAILKRFEDVQKREGEVASSVNPPIDEDLSRNSER